MTFGLIGEFDGLVKFRSAEMLAGRTPEEALAGEKRRGDRLRSTGPLVTRWMWAVLLVKGALADQLMAGGVRRR